jgi:molybdenum cofactor synthesis domain-containing protein
MIRALAITVSNRASAGVYEDRSGPVLVELLKQAGCDVVDGPLVIPDGEAVEEVLRDSVTAGYDVAVTTGGTGLTPMDQTPEMTRRVIDREIPGIPEALRSAGADSGVPSAILSRGLAGVASRTLIINLPGSSGGVRDGMNVLRRILVHAVDQIHGGDHPRPAAGSRHSETSHPETSHPVPEQSGHGSHSPAHGDAPDSEEHSAGIA